VIGVIADDFTGGTDVAVAFRREGLKTQLYFGVPDAAAAAPEADAAVIALKSRMAPTPEAVADSLAALAWLRAQGSTQTYFKYCSTFDSTAAGNIGPVLDALAEAIDAPSVLQTPSSPAHSRTQYLGYLFVGEQLLSDSHMRNHPVTPMRESSLLRLLGTQTTHPIGLVPHGVVRKGASGVLRAIASAEAAGQRYLFADAIDRGDLINLGRAALQAPLVAGAAGLASGLASAIAESSTALLGHSIDANYVGEPGPAVVLAGSCAARTLEQVAVMKQLGHPNYRIDPTVIEDPSELAWAALEWYDGLPGGKPPLIYTSLSPSELTRVHQLIGVQRSARILEEAISLIAVGLIARGVKRIVAAGGETSGAIVGALQIQEGLIGPEAAPGVPWILTEHGVSLLLKSGNFGEPDLLAAASAA
jgi:uncharacterized protein YgbK (DUF1537 family)